MVEVLTEILLPIGTLLALLIIRIPVGVALGVAGCVGLYVTGGVRAVFGQVDSLTYHVPATYTFAVIPFFVLMGALVSEGGLATSAYAAAHRWLGRLPGGLAMATTVGSGVMGAASGSTVANTAVFGRIAHPEMVAHGYDKRLSAGCVAATGTFAAMIPPSITMVLFGIITGTSISQLLVAGILPGILTIVLYLVGIYLLARARPGVAPRLSDPVSLRERFGSLRGLWGIGAIFVFVMGGIYFGYFTPTQAGAVGAAWTLLILVLTRRLRGGQFREALLATVTTTASLFFIVVGGYIFSRYLATSGQITAIVEVLTESGLGRWGVLLAIVAAYIVLGMFMDPASMLVITLPLTFPILVEVGFDAIWIGIIIVKIVEVAMITPPIGMNAYVLKSTLGDEISLREIFSGLGFFLCIEFVTLTLLIAFPVISLWLPQQM